MNNPHFEPRLGITWNNLIAYAQRLSPDERELMITFCTDDGEFIPVADIMESVGDDILDDGHPYLVSSTYGMDYFPHNEPPHEKGK